MISATEKCRAWLEVVGGQVSNVETSCSIGRLNSNQIILPHEKVSRRHAVVHAQGENEYWLIDLGSSNGTLLNGQRVTTPTRLKDGDQIEIGPFQLTFGCTGTALLEPAGPSEHTIWENKKIACWLLVTDIIGSTTLGRRLGPNELSVMFGGWFDKCRQIIQHSGGSLDKYLGDGFFAFWKDDAQTVAGVIEVLNEFKDLQHSASPDFRLVAHFGPVFSGGLATMGEARLFGPEVNFTFRMERLASQLKQPTLLSAKAAERVRERLPLRPLGQHSLPGFEGNFGFYSF